MDYPNYPASRDLNVVDYVRELNLERADRREVRLRRILDGWTRRRRRRRKRRSGGMTVLS